MSILIVEDDPTMREMLAYNINKEGYEVFLAENGAKAVNLTNEIEPKVAILDVMLPEVCGITVCKALKKKIPSVCVIMLSALSDMVTKEKAKNHGSDFFVNKPFSMRDLISLIKKCYKKTDLRPMAESKGEFLRLAEIEINAPTLRVFISGVELKLSAKEYQLFYYMVKNSGTLLTREKLAKGVWSYDFIGSSRTIDIHINSVRRKIKRISDKEFIKTVRGFGYMLDAGL